MVVGRKSDGEVVIREMREAEFVWTYRRGATRTQHTCIREKMGMLWEENVNFGSADKLEEMTRKISLGRSLERIDDI